MGRRPRRGPGAGGVPAGDVAPAGEAARLGLRRGGQPGAGRGAGCRPAEEAPHAPHQRSGHPPGAGALDRRDHRARRAGEPGAGRPGAPHPAGSRDPAALGRGAELPGNRRPDRAGGRSGGHHAGARAATPDRGPRSP